MPQVTNPPNGVSKSDSTSEWSMGQTDFVSSLVIVGSTPGTDDVYAGTEIQKENGTSDNHVTHLRDDGTYYTRAKFRVTPDGTWHTTNSTITPFISLGPNNL